ncbi:ATPase [Burkholderia humptydooensis]|uniref:Integral membrane ATPase n=1 Tax=Burkholderia humptydooensis MSMB43 TaxID=441157 RepID=A0ABN0G6P7_9BURK|nr:ATPase [Burkholderia humptydooensis]EIP87830.1 integral membrane ATPase [Burkholderia humptydooensis MSMB43]
MAALPDGLGSSEVTERRQRGDVNRIERRTSRSLADIVRANVFTRFNALLGSLCAAVLIAGPWQDALFGGVLVANSLIGIFQEWRAKRTLDRLALLHQPRTHVRRDGRTIEIDVADIVKDDLIGIGRGAQIVVDGVVAASAGLQVDESLLTGESEPQDKACGARLLSGSFVVAGQGWYRATAVGQQAWAHRLAAQARRFAPARSELAAGINRILRYAGWAIAPLSVLLVATQLLRQMPFAQAVLFSAGGVVGMVPEGLVLLTSVALAVGTMRLARRGTLMQALPAIETLARVDVVCIDKTGTLTQGEPVLEQVEMLAGDGAAHDALAALVLGEPAPNATLRAIASRYAVSPGWQANRTVPFSSARKWAGASFGERGTWVLGAPDVMLAGAAMADDVRAAVSRHAHDGRRVLLLARSDLPLADDGLPRPLTPVALVLLAERIRDDAPGTVAWFAAEGVSLKVISGDHPDTAAEVARRVGIASAWTGVDARALSDDGALLGELMERESVFGRVSPRQKAAMVAALRARGHVVAMVGDGVNDLLALKEADIGIAMGGGSSAAAAVAQAVLTDNRFASLPAIVNEGRRVIGNIERVANLFVTKTVYAMLLAFAVGIADLAFPFLPRHLTLVGSLTIGIPAFFLSLEPSAERAKSGFVERVLHFTVPSGVLAAIATFAAYAITLSYLHGTLDQARTAATVTLCAIALWILAQLARPFNASRLGIVAGMAAAFTAIVVVGRLRTFFAIEVLPVRIWLGATSISMLACSGMHALTIRSRAGEAPSTDGDAAATKPVLHALLSLWRAHIVFVTATLMLIVGSVWLFLGVLEDVISRDPLLQADLIVWRVLQDIRPSWLDSMMTGLSELGDAAVVVPVVLVVLSWLIWHRLWRAALYWLAAVGGAEVIVKLFKLLLHRARPNPFAAGIESFSFPSSHATLALVAYGFLAFLLSAGAGQRHRTRVAILVATTIAVTLIATSRLYLGVHWVSDVVAGASLGLAWVAGLAIAYSLRENPSIGSRKLTGIVVITMLAAAALHIVRHHDADVALYAPTRHIERMTAAQWRSHGWRALPVGRVAVVGRIDEPFTIQWAGAATAIGRALQAAGWRTAPGGPAWAPWTGRRAVVLKFHDGAPPAMTFVQGDAASPDMQAVLRLWRGDHVIERPSGSSADRDVPVWVGTVTRERASAAGSWTFSAPSVDEDFTSPARAFAQQFPGARSVTRDDAASARFRRWDRRVWLIESGEIHEAACMGSCEAVYLRCSRRSGRDQQRACRKRPALCRARSEKLSVRRLRQRARAVHESPAALQRMLNGARTQGLAEVDARGEDSSRLVSLPSIVTGVGRCRSARLMAARVAAAAMGAAASSGER